MLSTTSEYALRSLSHLASQPKGTAILGRDLAEQCGIPPNYLSKILLALRNAGIIDTARGNGGGYRLRREPNEIRLIEIVELFENHRAKPECLLWTNRECSDLNPCSAHESWKAVRESYVHFLQATTLACIAAKHSDRGPGNARCVGASAGREGAAR